MSNELAQQLIKAFLKSYTEPNLSTMVSRYGYSFKFLTREDSLGQRKL